jgi:predicted nucleic acid-binding protein
MDHRYWDSNVFLGWFQRESDKVPFCEPVLQAAAAGELFIVTSVLTLTEVLWLRGQQTRSGGTGPRS